jgi:hypothetical protein
MVKFVNIGITVCAKPHVSKLQINGTHTHKNTHIQTQTRTQTHIKHTNTHKNTHAHTQKTQTHTQVCEQDLTVIWNRAVHTGRELTANRSDITIKNKPNRQCMYCITLRRVCSTIVAVDKQYLLHILSVCICTLFNVCIPLWER